MTAALAVIFLITLAGFATAQEYPTRPITMIVPFDPGGPTDTVGRVLAQAMSKDLGQQVLVENVFGAGGTLGAARAARSDADGYTILLWHIGMASTNTLFKSLPFDAETSFAPIGLVSEVPMTLIGRQRLPVGDWTQLLAYLQRRGDAVNMAHAGIGSASHLCATLFQSVIGVKLTTVPYTGTAPAMQDLGGEYVDIMCDQATTTVNNIDVGSVRGYLVTGPERISRIPDVQTVAEAGLGGLEIIVWNGLWAPAGTPDAVLQRLNESLRVALLDEALNRRMATLATSPVPQERVTPQELSAIVTSEIERWQPLILAAGEFVE